METQSGRSRCLRLRPGLGSEGFDLHKRESDRSEQFWGKRRMFQAQSCLAVASSTFFMLSVGSKRSTTSPSRPTRNLVKFHLMAGVFL